MNCPTCNQEIQNENEFPAPKDVSLPFFAYGVFKPGELAFHRFRDVVGSVQSPCSIAGELRVRDGLPIVNPEGKGKVNGALIHFRSGAEHEAYARIAELQPRKQYRWETIKIDDIASNYLVGKSPMKGSIAFEGDEWNGKNDPLFNEALDVVQDTLNTHSGFDWDLKPLFHLEMAYMLLWTSIERYASLRYDLSGNATSKIMRICEEAAFQAALYDEVKDKRQVFRADVPSDKIVLDPADPGKSLSYYYQVRSNLVHRGKAADRDHEILLFGLRELLVIFRKVLASGFESGQDHSSPLSSR